MEIVDKGEENKEMRYKYSSKGSCKTGRKHLNIIRKCDEEEIKEEEKRGL